MAAGAASRVRSLECADSSPAGTRLPPCCPVSTDPRERSRPGHPHAGAGGELSCLMGLGRL